MGGTGMGEEEMEQEGGKFHSVASRALVTRWLWMIWKDMQLLAFRSDKSRSHCTQHILGAIDWIELSSLDHAAASATADALMPPTPEQASLDMGVQEGL